MIINLISLSHLQVLCRVPDSLVSEFMKGHTSLSSFITFSILNCVST